MAESKNFIVEHQFFREAEQIINLCYENFGKTPEPRCVAILGPSGSGKSTLIESCARKINESGSSNTIVIVECPSRPTLKAIASAVLFSLRDPHFNKGTEVQMTARIINILKVKKVRMLIFDEVQNLVDKDSEKLVFETSDWIKGLINRAKISVVIVGLERSEVIFRFNEQLRSRFKNFYILKPLAWKDPASRGQLQGFLKSVSKKIAFEEDFNITSTEMAYRFSCATGGLPRYIMSIVTEAERLASERGGAAIGLKHLAEAYSIAVCGSMTQSVNPFSEQDISKVELAEKVIEEAYPLNIRSKLAVSR